VSQVLETQRTATELNSVGEEAIVLNGQKKIKKNKKTTLLYIKLRPEVIYV